MVTYGLTTNTVPTRIECTHLHLFLTLHRGNQETESEQESDCTQRFITDKCTLFISTRATVLQRYISAYKIKDVASNKVATLRSVQSRIADILCYVVLATLNIWIKMCNCNLYIVCREHKAYKWPHTIYEGLQLHIFVKIIRQFYRLPDTLIIATCHLTYYFFQCAYLFA